MARARNLKPAFFIHEGLGEISPVGRLLFQGLWCLADREGRLKDRPKMIKPQILPYDDCDVDELLWQLAEAKFIVRYEVGGECYLQVLGFTKHQNPHHREPLSELPLLENGAFLRSREKPRQALGQDGTSPEPAVLIPDSLNLIPDSPLPSKEPSASLGKYAFEGDVVKITHDQQSKWQNTFTSINVIEHLKGIDKTYAKEKAEGRDISYWFPRCSQALARANQQALSRKGGYDV